MRWQHKYHAKPIPEIHSQWCFQGEQANNVCPQQVVWHHESMTPDLPPASNLGGRTEDIIYEGHPSWRSIWDFYAKGVIGFLIVGAILYFAVGAGIASAVFAGGVVITILFGLLKRVFTVYMISDQRLVIRRGIISRHIQQARISRVQNVNINQGVLDRMLRIGDVDFDTAGTDDSEFCFAGIANPQQIVTALDKAQREWEADHQNDVMARQGLG